MFKFGSKQRLIDWLVAAGLFGLALWLRTSNLAHFVTADEHNWIYRSGLFLHALLRQDWPGTSVWYTPAVTTTWLGSGSLALFYYMQPEAINRPFAEWLVSFSRNKIDLDVLLTLRWSVALFTSLMAVVVYGLARKVWPRPLALLGTLFLITEPHLLAVSRIIGHDALITFFVISALLSFLYAKRLLAAPSRSQYGWFALSGLFAGLAILSKAPALILIPFTGLIAVTDVWRHKDRLSGQIWTGEPLSGWIWAGIIWGGVLCLTFIALWPAAWVNPLEQIWYVVSRAFFSSTGSEDADIQPYWATPDLGYLYYLVNGAYKISPLLLIGTVLAGVKAGNNLRHSRTARQTLPDNEIFWLTLFSGLFTLMMTLGAKQSPRYILPVFPALAFVAAWGWLSFSTPAVVEKWPVLRRVSKSGIIAVLGALAVILTLNYAPYYFSYFNPLLGGARTAPSTVRVGWGEGLDEVGRWLNSRPNAPVQQVGARYTSSLYPFFQGAISSPISEELDYVTFYIKQSQSGYPHPEILAYFENQTPLHKIRLNGIEYAQIYQGPGMQLVETGNSADLPLAFRPHTIYAPIGQTLTIDLLWPGQTAQNVGHPINLTLQLADNPPLLESTASISTTANGTKISRHPFDLPAGMARNTYTLRVDGTPIGTIRARSMSIPPDFEPLSAVLAGQIKLAGLKHRQAGNRLLVDAAWQGWPQATNNYTVFVQLLDEAGQRVAGVDVTPEREFTSLDRKEIMITHYDIPLPDTLKPGLYNLLIGLYYFAGDELINVGAVPLEKAVTLE